MTDSPSATAQPDAGPRHLLETPFLVFGILAAIWLIAFFPTIQTIIVEWLDAGTYSHGFLVLVIAIYAAWPYREVLATPDTRSAGLALPVLLASALGWWLAEIANVNAVRQLAAFAIICVATVAVFGIRRLRPMAFSALVLLSVFPVWDYFREPLQQLATWSTHWTLAALNIPVLVRGFEIDVPGGRFVVEEACAGLGFILCALVLCAFYGRLNHLSSRDTWIYCGLGVALAIVSNWLRIIVIVLIGNASNMQSPIVTEHLMFGWVLFSVLLIPLLWIGGRFPSRAAPETAVPTRVGGEFLPALVAASLAIVAAMPVIDWALSYRIDPDRDTFEFPAQAGDLARVESRRDWSPVFHGASEIRLATYRDRTVTYDALWVSYGRQDQDAELVNGLNSVYDKDRWKLVESTSTEDAVQLTLRDRYGTGRKILYSYRIFNRNVSSKLLAKLLEIPNYLAGSERASLLAISAGSDVDWESMRQFKASLDEADTSN